MRLFVAAAAVFAIVVSTAQAQPPRRSMTPQQRAQRQLQQAQALVGDLQAERPIEALDSVWIEELTWMEVRDALKAGKTTAIIPTGGIEQNGPYLATGKHNYVLVGACEGIARKLGNALCAPILKFVPEGDIDNPTGHMRYPGTISLRHQTYRMVLDDIASSLRAHGFTNIVLIGDSGGNQVGLREVAGVLNERWARSSVRAHFIPEFYEYEKAIEWMNRELGIVEPVNEGLHDDFSITAMMMVTDPESVRYSQRVAAGKASINGVSIEDRDKTIEVGRKVLGYRVDQTVKAIQASIGAN